MSDPVDTDLTNATTVNYVLTKLAEPVKFLDAVVVSSMSNVTISSPGATIDGVTMSVDDRVLLQAQLQVQDGIYLFKGAAVAMIRSADAGSVQQL